MRYFFEIAYNGKNFHGWQRQSNANSVQEEVEKALSTILRQPVPITGSGRTDTGVHCEQQFFHVDFDEAIADQNMQHKLNSFLPESIAINSVNAVTDNAHARFSALYRTYQYRITLKKDPFLNNLSYFYPRSLDIDNMNEASAFLLGEQDFECFSKVKTEVNNFICDIMSAKWYVENDILTFKITANRFLRGMVRAIVGTMLQVGSGKIIPSKISDIIATKDRRQAGAAAPAEGLFLTQVAYPETIYKSGS